MAVGLYVIILFAITLAKKSDLWQYDTCFLQISKYLDDNNINPLSITWTYVTSWESISFNLYAPIRYSSLSKYVRKKIINWLNYKIIQQ